MNSVRVLAIAVLGLCAAGGWDAARADELRDATKRLGEVFKPEVKASDRLAAVDAVAMHDGRDAAQALVEAVGAEEKLLAPILARKAEADAELEKLIGPQMLDEQRTFPSGTLDLINKLKRESQQLLIEIDGENRVLARIENALGSMRDEAAIDWLGRTALLRQDPWKARQIVAGALLRIGTPVAGEYLAKGLRDKDDRVRLTVAVGVGKLKVASALKDLLGLLDDKAWPVRSAAIQALGEIGEKAAVGALIDQMEEEDGELREDCAQALAKLTGLKFGQSVESWRRWWEAHKDEYGGDAGKPLGGHPPDKPHDAGAGYYGIPITTNRAIFIIDVSGSMTKAMSNPNADPGPNELSKIEAAKKELMRAIEGFDPKGFFNVIIFNDTVKRWQEKMTPATKPMKEQAKQFVGGLTAASSTNIYDALDMAFKVAGMGARDKYYELGADTIFLLSDGSPTNPDGSAADWQMILRACREWNRLDRVKIHAIGIGGHNAAFMSQLAGQNGGQYVSR